MKKKVRVFVDQLSWNLGTNTDALLRKKMKCLEREFDDIEFYYPKSFLLSFLPNAKKILFYILRKVGIHVGNNKSFKLRIKEVANYWEVLFAKPDVIYSYGGFPKHDFGKPCLVELYFYNPSAVRDNTTALDNENYLVSCRLLEEKIKSPYIINVRSYYSTNLIRSVAPDYIHKIRNLFFLLPDLKPLDKSAIIAKHTNAEVLHILFCGAQAKRKGLPMLLDAYRIFEKKYPGKSVLHVVSAMSDGAIDKRNLNSVIFYGSLEYGKTQELFAKCHVYAMPSIIESFGITYVEAMAKGLLVIARNYEPQKEILGYGEYGKLTDIDNRSIFRTLEDVYLMSEPQRKAMVLKAFQQYMDRYDYNVVKQQWHQAILNCYSYKKTMQDS